MKLFASIVLSLMLVFTSGLSHSAERYALVIGNSQYSSNALQTPRNDAVDMAAELSNLGYKIHGGSALLDANLETFEKALLDFAISLPNKAVALVYYAGHGAMHESDNFLLPVDFTSGWKKSQMISLRDATQLLEYHNPDGLNVMLLDACRDNSFLTETSTRSLSSGLARIGGARGSFIGYAAEEGKVAFESKNERNGFYTGALLAELRDNPSAPIQILHSRVAARVIEKTTSKQWPTAYDRSYGEFCFGACAEDNMAGSETGSFSIQSDPENAKVCFYLDSWMCGNNVKLPIGDEYSVFASASGFEDYKDEVELQTDGQPLQIQLRSLQTPAPVTEAAGESKLNMKTIGIAAVAILVVGALMSGGDSSPPTDPNSVIVNLPSLP